MCGRYTLRRIDQLRRGFEATLDSLFEEFTDRPRFNIAPSQRIPVIRLDANGKRVVSAVQWGLIPSWTRGKPKLAPINARAETLATSRMFGQAYERRRCLIPADGFYEWKQGADGKQPMYIHREDYGLFAFAGLWERWKPSEDGEPIDTCTIITTAPNALMSPIHSRMPVVVNPRDYDRWLSRTEPPPADALGLWNEKGWTATPVSKTVNSPRNDVAECVAPLADDSLSAKEDSD